MSLEIGADQASKPSVTMPAAFRRVCDDGAPDSKRSHHAFQAMSTTILPKAPRSRRSRPAALSLPPSRLRFDDLEAIADAAEAGYGLAWLPCWLIRDRVRTGALVPLLEDVPRLVFKTHALWPEAPHLPLRVRFAIDALAAALPGSAEL